jgi:shikimate kinase
MLIFLIGMPGSGKTSIGRELAKETGYRLMDLDAYIVDKEKLSIPNIFKTKGEDYFRAAETRCLKEIMEKVKDSIIAVGGGTPCYNNNMQLMQNGGKTIYLKASVDSLVKRIEDDSNERPLFAKMNGRKLHEKIESMLSHREKFYRKAPMSFDTEGRTPAQCAKELAPLLK